MDETQMPIASEHAFKEKSTTLLVLLPLRTIYNRTFQCETPCTLAVWYLICNFIERKHSSLGMHTCPNLL